MAVKMEREIVTHIIISCRSSFFIVVVVLQRIFAMFFQRWQNGRWRDQELFLMFLAAVMTLKLDATIIIFIVHLKNIFGSGCGQQKDLTG